jgi:hypothetical protein
MFPRRFWFQSISLLLLLNLASALPIATAQDGPLPLTQTYTTYHGLTFSYPEGWYIGTSESANIGLYDQELPEQDIDIIIAYAPADEWFYPARTDLGPDATPRQQLEATVANSSREFVHLGLISEMTIGGRPAAHVDGAFENDAFLWIVTKLEDGSVLGMFTYGAADKLTQIEPTVQAIIASAVPPGVEPPSTPVPPLVTASSDGTFEPLPLSETFTMDHDLIFSYPQGWYVKLGEAGNVVLYSSEQVAPFEPNEVFIAVEYALPGERFGSLNRELDSDVPPSVLVDAMLIRASDMHTITDLGPTTEITIEGKPASTVTGVYGDEDPPYAFLWMIARLENEDVFGLFAYGTVDTLPQIEPTMQAIIVSAVCQSSE